MRDFAKIFFPSSSISNAMLLSLPCCLPSLWIWISHDSHCILKASILFTFQDASVTLLLSKCFWRLNQIKWKRLSFFLSFVIEHTIVWCWSKATFVKRTNVNFTSTIKVLNKRMALRSILMTHNVNHEYNNDQMWIKGELNWKVEIILRVPNCLYNKGVDGGFREMSHFSHAFLEPIFT